MQLAEALGVQPVEAVKKSIEPLSILQLTAAFVAGGVAAGFLNKLGADLTDYLKVKLKLLMARKADQEADRVLRFVFELETEGGIVEADVYLTNPTDEDIEAFLPKGLEALDTIAPRLIASCSSARKLTFEFRAGALELRFAVRSGGVPLLPTDHDGDVSKVKLAVKRGQSKQP